MTTLPTFPATVNSAEKAIRFLAGGLATLYPTLDKRETTGGEATKRIIITPNVTDPEDYGKLLTVVRLCFSTDIQSLRGQAAKRPHEFIQDLGNLTFPVD